MSSENRSTDMYNAIYTVNDAQYSITDTEEVHLRLQSNADFLSEYLANSTTAPELVSVLEAESNSEATNNTGTESKTRNFVWSKQATKLFLNCYLDRKENFRNPKMKKKSLWTEILQIMKENGYTDLNEDLLDRKMRNMKKSYKNIKDNNKKSNTGRGRVSWEYFDTFEDIFANDMTINCASILSSMQKDKDIASDSIEDDHEVTTLTNLPDFFYMLISSSHAVQNITVTSQQYDSNITTLSKRCCNILCCMECTSSILPFQPIHCASPGCSSEVSSPISPISVTPPIPERSEKSYRMSSLNNMRKKQLDIEERRIKAILELKSSLENSNNIQKERNDLLRNLLLKISRTETEKNT